MSRIRKHAFGWSFVCLAGFLGVLISVTGNGFVGVDQSVMEFVHGYRTDGLTPVAVFLSLIGDVAANLVLALVALVVLFKVFQHRSELVMFLASLGGSVILNQVLKHLIERARPLETAIVMETGYSFPSGHSMASVALYGTLVYLLWRHVRSGGGRVLLTAVALAMVLAIGASRVYLGVHYPSDVLGGYLLSTGWLLAVIGLYETYRNRKHPAGMPQVKEAPDERIQA